MILAYIYGITLVPVFADPIASYLSMSRMSRSIDTSSFRLPHEGIGSLGEAIPGGPNDVLVVAKSFRTKTFRVEGIRLTPTT